MNLVVHLGELSFVDKMKIDNLNFNLMKEELNKIEIFNFDSSLDKFIDGGSNIETFDSIILGVKVLNETINSSSYFNPVTMKLNSICLIDWMSRSF